MNTLDQLLNSEWAKLGRSLSPQIDERLLFRVFESTVTCWLALELLLRVDKKSLKLPSGRRRIKSKVPSDLIFRYFTQSDLASIYFLVVIEFFSIERLDKLNRFQEFIGITLKMNFKSELRAVFTDLSFLFESGGGAGIQKRLSRTRSFLLKNGFSHIRLDFITGHIRLCPITKDFDPSATLYMSQQTQKDIVSPEVEQTWVDKFGTSDRGFYEIPLDKRVYDFHRNVIRKKKSQHNIFKGVVEKTAPKYGIIILPLLSALLAAEGFSFVLFDQDRKKFMQPISKSKKSAAKSVSPKML